VVHPKGSSSLGGAEGIRTPDPLDANRSLRPTATLHLNDDEG
jgi:hypothetical protein